MQEEANSTFIFLTDISYDYGLITEKIYWQRISYLYKLNGLPIDHIDFPEIYRKELDFENVFANLNKTDSLEDSLGNTIKISRELYLDKNILYFITNKRENIANGNLMNMTLMINHQSRMDMD